VQLVHPLHSANWTGRVVINNKKHLFYIPLPYCCIRNTRYDCSNCNSAPWVDTQTQKLQAMRPLLILLLPWLISISAVAQSATTLPLQFKQTIDSTFLSYSKFTLVRSYPRSDTEYCLPIKLPSNQTQNIGIYYTNSQNIVSSLLINHYHTSKDFLLETEPGTYTLFFIESKAQLFKVVQLQVFADRIDLYQHKDVK